MDQTGRVLVVEDDAELRGLLEASLRRAGLEVCAAHDAAEAMQALREFRPDVAVLDIHLGDGPDGLALARQIRERGDLPFLFLTERASVEDRLAGFESGADDFLAKPFVVAELVARIRVLLRRRPEPTPDVFQFGGLRIEEAGRRVLVHDQPVELTRIEFELLSSLAKQAGTVASKPDLLSRVWGFEGYDQNLVEVHVSSLRKKLKDQASIVQTVRGVGYVLRAADS